jgi:DNA N6-methyl adenine demethylase
VNFKKQKVQLDQFTGLPDFSRTLVEKINEKSQLSDFNCVELCNLEYVPQRESCIDAHIDDEWLWGERLITLNLASSSFLTLSPLHPVDGEFPLVRVAMPRRSLFVMMADSRHKWKHAIRADDILERRLAMTFRELTPEFITGSQKELGKKILDTAYGFNGDVVRSC